MLDEVNLRGLLHNGYAFCIFLASCFRMSMKKCLIKRIPLPLMLILYSYHPLFVCVFLNLRYTINIINAIIIKLKSQLIITH